MSRVLVILTAYNMERFVGESIKSVLRQVQPVDWRMVVIDDQSTDGTRNVINAVVNGDPRVLVQTAETHFGGAAGSRNLGLELGFNHFGRHFDAVAFLDGDDMWSPLLLARRAAFLASVDPSVLGVWGPSSIVDENGTYVRSTYTTEGLIHARNGQANPSFVTFHEELLGPTFVDGVTPCLFRSEPFLVGRPFDEQYRLLSDCEFVLRLLASDPGKGLLRVDVGSWAHRRRPGQVTENRTAVYVASSRILNQYVSLVEPDLRWRAYENMARAIGRWASDDVVAYFLLGARVLAEDPQAEVPPMDLIRPTGTLL